MAKGKKANIFVWIILGLLIIGLAGFGLENFGNTVRSIGSVGDRNISTGDYSRALQQEMRAIQAERGTALSISQAEEMGLDSRVIGQLVTIAALENEADRLPLSVGDETVAREILDIPAFRGAGGAFDRETYRFAIQSQGFTERTFEERLRDEIARTILQAAVIGGVEAPEAQVSLLFDHIAQRRTIDVLTLGPEHLDTPLPDPDEETLRAHHAERIDGFTRPELREITYVLVTPDMILDEVEVDEDTLRTAYDQRLSEFVRPERRLVERLVFSTDAVAEAAAARIAAGEAFDDIVAERELALEDIDLGDVSERDLGAAGAAVFALAEPDVVGPLPSPLGPALFRVNAILNAQETPFEEAAEGLREELAADRARRVIADAREDLVDLVAGGATLEEIADETMMQLGRIEWHDGVREGIAGYPEFREVAAAVESDDFAVLHELSDGGLFALRLDQIIPAAPEPFEAVRDAVTEDWVLAETRRRLMEQAEALRASGSLPRAPDSAAADLDLGLPGDDPGIEPGSDAEALPGEDAPDAAEAADTEPTPTAPRLPDVGPGEFALGEDVVASDAGPAADRFEALGRNAFLPGLPEELIATAFQLAENEIRIVPGENGAVHLVQLVEVLGPDADAPQVGALRGLLAEQTGQAIAQDIFAHFVTILEREAGVTLDSRAVSAVNASFR